MYTPSYVMDLKNMAPGTLVTLTGQYVDRRNHRDRVSIAVRDITGTTFAALREDHIADIKNIAKFSRIRLSGSIDLSRDGRSVVIAKVDRVENLGSLKGAFADLSSEMREYASRMFLSRVIASCLTTFRDAGFDEFESKVISSDWTDAGLEPLQVKFPGFGNPATLITSPNAQVMDFLNATGVDRAFTASLSFTSTFRHANNAAETKVILAKAINLAFADLRNLALSVCIRALGRLQVPLTDPPAEIVLAEWPAATLNPSETCTLRLVEYESGVRTSGAGWRSMLLDRVVHVVGPTGIILADCAVEKIGERDVSTLAVYPARFLSQLASPSPRRQLSDLTEYRSWHL